MVLAELALTACAIASASLAVVVPLWQVRALRARCADLEERMASAERTVADASAVALAAADAMSEVDTASPEASGPPRVIGYGQTRGPRTRYVYRDVRRPDGSTFREYLPVAAPSRGAWGGTPP